MRDAAFESSDDQTQTEPDVTLHAIRSLLTHSDGPVTDACKPVTEACNPVTEDRADTAAVQPETHVSQHAAGHPGPENPAAAAGIDLSPLKAAIDTLRGRVTNYRPTKRHIFWAVFALVAVLRPHWILLSVLITLFVIAGAFACFGAERVWAKMTVLFRAYAKRYPESAARLSDRLDRFALRWDTILDRFPEGSVDGLYLPDVRAIQARDDAHMDAMDARLARMQSESRT